MLRWRGRGVLTRRGWLHVKLEGEGGFDRQGLASC